MSKTVQEIQSWLISADIIKVLLVEVDSVNLSETLADTTTVYLSSKPYISETGINYNPCIIGGISYSENLNIDGTASLSYGDIELDNTDGSNDAYLSYIWKNRSISIYIGDARWNKSDFCLIFKGIVSDIGSRNRNTLNITLLDTIARMNTAVSENLYKYTGSVGKIITNYQGSNVRIDGIEDDLLPITFGECFNVAPKLVAESYYKDGSWYGQLFQFNDTRSEGVIEVRDNGAPVTHGVVSSNGCLNLRYPSYGNITASVQGYRGTQYSSTLFEVVRDILINYGKQEYRPTYADLDFPITSYIGSNNPNVGYYCSDRENVLDLCNKLTSSAGYQLVNTTVTSYVGSSTNVSAAGKLRLIRIDLQNITPIYTITDDDILLHTLNISETIAPKTGIKINFCKNWSPQVDGLAEALNPASVDFFKNEWMIESTTITPTSDQSNKTSLFQDSSEVIPVDTYLISCSEAKDEVKRRATFYSTKRYIFTATYLPHMFFAQLGDGVLFNLSSNKFSNILYNKTGIIYSINRNWLNNTIELGVLV